MSKDKSVLLSKTVIVTFLVFLSILVIAICFLFSSCNKDGKAISVSYMSAKLEKASELTTAKLNVTGVLEYEDSDGVPFISKEDFTMVYNATITAGIKFDKVKINVDEEKKIIKFSIPSAEIFDAHVDPSSIKYFDEDFALFNLNPKEDANNAQKLAEEDAKEKAPDCGILEYANTQAETLLKGLLGDYAEGYKFEFEKMKAENIEETTTKESK